MIYTAGSSPDRAALQAMFVEMAECPLERRGEFLIDHRENPVKVIYRRAYPDDPAGVLFSGTMHECLLYIEKQTLTTAMCRLSGKFPCAPFVLDELKACFNHYDPDTDQAEEASRIWAMQHFSTPQNQCPPCPVPPPLLPRENLRDRLREVLDYGLRLFMFSCCR